MPRGDWGGNNGRVGLRLKRHHGGGGGPYCTAPPPRSGTRAPVLSVPGTRRGVFGKGSRSPRSALGVKALLWGHGECESPRHPPL